MIVYLKSKSLIFKTSKLQKNEKLKPNNLFLMPYDFLYQKNNSVNDKLFTFMVPLYKNRRYMKKIYVTAFSVVFSFGIMAQTQIGNSGFENWEAISDGFEPVNWNSFLDASGGMSGFAQSQIEESTDIRPGSSGTKSAKIWSRSVFGIIANGNVTLGRINMGSSSPSNSSNYNRSVTADPNYSETLTVRPDSIVFWVKFTPNGHSENARMKATIHDNYDYRDPEDAAATDHVVGTAITNFPSTAGEWVRKSIPFDYSGVASDQQFILVTFATNETPGGGANNDQVWIDDVELIYNESLSVKKETFKDVSVYPTPTKGIVNIDNIQEKATYSIVSLLGEVVAKGELTKQSNSVDIRGVQNGVYLLQVQQGKNNQTIRIIKQ